MHKSIAVTLTIRRALAEQLADVARPLDERMLLALATIAGPGWYCSRVNRRGFAVVDLAALVPEGGAQLLTLAPTPRQRRRVLRDLARYDGLLFVGCELQALGSDLAPVRVQGVKMDAVRAAEAARDMWRPDTPVRLAHVGEGAVCGAA